MEPPCWRHLPAFQGRTIFRFYTEPNAPDMTVIVALIIAIPIFIFWLAATPGGRVAMFLLCLIPTTLLSLIGLQLANGPQGAAILRGESTFHPFNGALALIAAITVAWIIASVPLWNRPLNAHMAQRRWEAQQRRASPKPRVEPRPARIEPLPLRLSAPQGAPGGGGFSSRSVQ
jgi:hypothetical protein